MEDHKTLKKKDFLPSSSLSSSRGPKYQVIFIKEFLQLNVLDHRVFYFYIIQLLSVFKGQEILPPTHADSAPAGLVTLKDTLAPRLGPSALSSGAFHSPEDLWGLALGSSAAQGQSLLLTVPILACLYPVLECERWHRWSLALCHLSRVSSCPRCPSQGPQALMSCVSYRPDSFWGRNPLFGMVNPHPAP